MLETAYVDETRRICDEDDDLAEVTPAGIKTTPFLKTRINACCLKHNGKQSIYLVRTDNEVFS